MSVIETEYISNDVRNKMNVTVAVALISELNKQGLITDNALKACKKRAEVIIDGKQSKRS